MEVKKFFSTYLMKVENPKVSVIVTTFNRQKFLLRTLMSIVNQTYKNLEIIVVDNYSNYDFFGLIKSIGDSELKHIRIRIME